MTTIGDDRIGEIGQKLYQLVEGAFGGGSDPARVSEVKQLVMELKRLLPNTALSLRIASLVSDVETACSPGKWRRQGIEFWRNAAREDAYVIMTHAGD